MLSRSSPSYSDEWIPGDLCLDFSRIEEDEVARMEEIFTEEEVFVALFIT